MELLVAGRGGAGGTSADRVTATEVVVAIGGGGGADALSGSGGCEAARLDGAQGIVQLRGVTVTAGCGGAGTTARGGDIVAWTGRADWSFVSEGW